MTADNRYFSLIATPLQKSLDIAFGGSPSGKATHWKVDGKRLILAWNEDAGYTPFPAPVDAYVAAEFVKGWLSEQNYGPQPDHDGDNEKSHHVYCESWGTIGYDQYSFVAIEPAWAMFGK